MRFTSTDAPLLAVVYAEALTEEEIRGAEAQGGVDLSDTGLVAVANHVATYALAHHGIDAGTGGRIGDDPDLANPTHNGEPIDPMVNVLALLTEQVGRIADNTAQADVHVPIEAVLKAWDDTGMRADQDLALAFIKALPGVIVDE